MTNHYLLPSPDVLDHRSHSFHHLLLASNSHHTGSRSLLTEETLDKQYSVEAMSGLTKVNVMLPPTETIEAIMKLAPVLATAR